ncbi:MAG: hypothetical protein AB8B81_20390 [Halioglobus sp.]
MNKVIKFGMAGLLSLTLGACYHVELNGPVSGSTIVITELRTGEIAQDNLTTFDEATSIATFTQEAWDGYADIVRLVVLGNFFTERSNFVGNQLYLVTATGGRDEDANADGAVDDQVTEVAGSLHAIMRGSQLRRGALVVSPITEALYQSVKDDIPQLSDSELLSLLGEKTRVILDEVNDKDETDYNDALSWSELAHLDDYRLNFSAVEDLADAITAGASESEIAELSAIVLGETASVDPLEFFTQNISTPIVQSRCINCHTPGGLAPNSGARLILMTSSNPDHLSINQQAFITLRDLLGSTDLSDYVTRKASAQISHGGGRQLVEGSDDLLNLETYLNLLE